MIKEIYDMFYSLSEKHILINSFRYDKLKNTAGVGDDYYPQVFIEEPIKIHSNTYEDKVTYSTLSFNVIMSLTSLQNYDVVQPTPQDAQSLAHQIALTFINKIQNDYIKYEKGDSIEYQPYKVYNYDIVTLRNWFDNDASGVRVTLTLERINPLNKCEDNEMFDELKEFDINNYLVDIDTSYADGCVKFDFKLPEINY